MSDANAPKPNTFVIDGTEIDIRPGLLVQLGFAAADFAFLQWLRQSTASPRPLDRYVTEALEAVKSPHWKRKKTS